MRYRHTTRSSGPYRSRHGVVFGVCRGLAEYFDFSLVWIRMCFVGAAVFTGFWPALAGYVLAAILMKPEPVVPLETEAEAEFYNTYATSRTMALHRLKRTFDNLDRRIQRIEGIVTAPEYDWDRRFDKHAGER